MGDDKGNLHRPRVLTVTVNPSLDTTAQVERVDVLLEDVRPEGAPRVEVNLGERSLSQ